MRSRHRRSMQPRLRKDEHAAGVRGCTVASTGLAERAHAPHGRLQQPPSVPCLFGAAARALRATAGSRLHFAA
jgi:hypothetical protein